MTTAPQLQAPPGACDTHLHVYDARYPLAPTATGPAPQGAGFAEYREVQRRLGLGRAVIVQPTAYGFDNRATLEGIAALGPERARGVAVVDDTVTDDELRTLHEGGIRGVRFQMLPGGRCPGSGPTASRPAPARPGGTCSSSSTVALSPTDWPRSGPGPGPS